MSQTLPEKEFDFLLDEQVKSFDVATISDDSPVGYILEVDLEYPEELHDLHNDYPLCPEKLVVSIEDLSPYTKSLAVKLNISSGSSQKLISNLKTKVKYVVHYVNLKLYLSLGMKILKVHRILSFTQSKWLKPYIDFNTNQRKRASNKFEQDFFKLMINAVFGKTMENIRKHQDVRLVSGGRRFRKLSARPNFKSFKILSEELVAVNMNKIEVKLMKPTYIGMAILDLSKATMYAFHYENIINKYKSRARLLMTDTDSLVYHIQTDDVYNDMLQNLGAYDTSDYPTDHKLFSLANKKVLGVFKDENKGQPIKEFIGLRPKMYSILEANDNEKKTAKGIGRNASNKLRHSEYLSSLKDEISTNITMQQIRSYSHEVYTIQLKKTGLSPYDDKRYVLDDHVSTLAYGHYSINTL